jgi:hypothetical protein
MVRMKLRCRYDHSGRRGVGVVNSMGVVIPIAAFMADKSWVSVQLRLPHSQAPETDVDAPPCDTPMPRRLVYTAVLAVSLAAWFGVVELGIMLARML